MNRTNVLTAMNILYEHKEKLKDQLEVETDPAKAREIQEQLMGCHEGYNILETALRTDRMITNLSDKGA